MSPAADGSADRLGERFGLDRVARDRLGTLADRLMTDDLAPTTVRDRRRVYDDHLADALVALELDEVRRARALVDVGAGAGLPGLPIAIAQTDTAVTLLEANGRKCAFLADVVSELGLENVTVVNGRAESWAEGQGRHDVVTARALAPLEVVAEYAAPLLTMGGTLVAWRGQRQPEVEEAATRAAEQLGLEIGRIIRVRPFPGAEHRYLHLMSKVTDTPPRFPRRPGMARKRPLGGRDVGVGG